MSVGFVDICKTLGLTTTHVGNFKGLDILLMIATAGLFGLHMLLGATTWESLIIVAALLYFAIANIMEPLAANNELKKVRA
jgi:hypothetical protein